MIICSKIILLKQELLKFKKLKNHKLGIERLYRIWRISIGKKNKNLICCLLVFRGLKTRQLLYKKIEKDYKNSIIN